MEPLYAGQYRELYERHWWWRAREGILLSILKRLLGGATGLRILDVGCGDGLFFPKLEQFGTVEGIEPDDAVFETDSPDSRIFRGTLEEFRPAHSYDVILFLDVIEHIENEVPLLERARQLLSPAGFVLVTVPAFMQLWTHHDRLNQHYRRYSKNVLRERLLSAGFSVVDVEYVFVWTAVVKLFVHWLERWRPNPATRAHVPARWVNRLLTFVCRAEYALTSRLGTPFGSSAIAIARPARSPDLQVSSETAASSPDPAARRS
ncbi:MAG: class I SAM-dependent methyltransferase [Thermoanaerobaculia bacterium]|nr:class I SAM-dependent methyltransferase [Thermoanaerobaculia bacterium]